MTSGRMGQRRQDFTQLGDVAQRHVAGGLDNIQLGEGLRLHQPADVINALRQRRRRHQSIHRFFHRCFDAIPHWNNNK